MPSKPTSSISRARREISVVDIADPSGRWCGNAIASLKHRQDSQPAHLREQPARSAALRDLLLEFGVGEALDSLLIRPALMYAARATRV
jgi:hypothetical protein